MTTNPNIERAAYTPATNTVQTVYAVAGRDWDNPVAERRAAFDRWLAAHDEQVRKEHGERLARWFEKAIYAEPRHGRTGRAYVAALEFAARFARGEA